MFKFHTFNGLNTVKNNFLILENTRKLFLILRKYFLDFLNFLVTIARNFFLDKKKNFLILENIFLKQEYFFLKVRKYFLKKVRKLSP